MTSQEIVQGLRCTSTPGGLHEDCTGCPYYRKEQLDAELKEKLGVDTWPSCDVNKVGMDAAELIERLTAENAALREKQRWALVIERIFWRHGARESPTGCHCRKRRREDARHE